MTDEQHESGEFEQKLREATAELTESIAKGDLTEAVNLLQQINDERHRNLYQEVGRLTRALHDAINNFHIDAGLNPQASQQMSEMADASDRLNYVIGMTQEAANTTMDKVEECTPINDGIGREASQLRKEWAKLMSREMKADEFRGLYKRIDLFLEHVETQSNVLSEKFGEITLAQGYQDLTGQVLKRVSNLVHEVESSLVNLVCMAGQVDRITGIRHPQKAPQQVAKEEGDGTLPEGPIVSPDKRSDVVANQDEVDDLLSSLGF